MATNIYKLAEQIKLVLGKGEIQEYASVVRQQLGIVVKNNFYQGKNDGISEIDGQFLYPFNNLTPIMDEDNGEYYIEIPSAYLSLPHEAGINSVSLQKSSKIPIIRITSGYQGILSGTMSEGMEGFKTYYVIANRIYFPDMDDVADIRLVLGVAFDTIDDEDDLNISPDLQAIIINTAVQQFMPQQSTPTQILAQQ